MQIQTLRIKSYRSWRIDESTHSETARRKLKQLRHYHYLTSHGCTQAAALEVLGFSRSTLFRYKRLYEQQGISGLEPHSKRPRNVRKPLWDRELERLVLNLRRQEATWGKIKIRRLLQRDYQLEVSESTVGRIISRLIACRKIKPAYLAARKNKPKRRRIFNQHALPWKYGMKGKQPGELVQIDHMSIYCNSARLKHFKAVCPVSRFMVCEVYMDATSRTAAQFLKKVMQEMPFKISSIQVDGGSEFRKEFETFCEHLSLELRVLPPRSPKYNGTVERCNSTTRDEFYSQYTDIFTVSTLRPYLQLYQNKFNAYRPHQGLNNLTPVEYIKSWLQNMAA